MQQILKMYTERPDLRAKVDGWTCEDPSLVSTAFQNLSLEKYPEYCAQEMMPIGYVNAPKFFFSHPTVLHALADGWKLLAPPVEFKDKREDLEVVVYEWWLVK